MSLEKLEKKAKKASIKAQKARDKLPKKKKIVIVRTFDEETGRASHHLAMTTKRKVVKDSLVKKGTRRIKNEAVEEIHKKISEVEHENDAVRAAHETEKKVEDTVRFVKCHERNKQQKLQHKSKKADKKEIKANTKYRYKKFIQENPQYEHDLYKKWNTKRRIRKNYNQKIRSQMAASTQTLLKAVKEIFEKKKGALFGVAAILFLFILIASSLGSCVAMFAGGGSTTTACSYASEPEEIDQVENRFTELELELQNTVDHIERDHPGYDEYRYNIGPIGHDPFTLVSYISATNSVFTYAGVSGQVENVFNEMYQLTFSHVQETRTRTETRTGHRTIHHADGTTSKEDYEYEVEVEYTVDILESTLTVKPMSQIAAEHLTSDQLMLYNAYDYTHGGLQQFASPLNLYWYNYVTGYYGHRKNPNTRVDEFHNGIDIGVPDGMSVYCGMDGTVSDVGTDSYYGTYICISNSAGFLVKYAHLGETSVTNGQAISKGTIIGKTGHSGTCVDSHLHLEVTCNGIYYNPMFYFDAEHATLYGEDPTDTGGAVRPLREYDDAAVRALLEEADRYVGYPYVWGGSSPRTSFDCSGYVYWVYNNSGYASFGRTTAQGLYNMCTPVSPSDARPGDMVFFTRTYNSGTTVTHVGIYCGNGVMVHCGDPIKYASLSTPYWTNHFYSFGRIR